MKNLSINLSFASAKQRFNPKDISDEQMLAAKRVARIRSPGMDSLYEIIDGVEKDQTRDWKYKVKTKQADVLTKSANEKGVNPEKGKIVELPVQGKTKAPVVIQQGDVLSCSINGKEYSLEKTRADNPNGALFTVKVAEEGKETGIYAISKRAYDFTLGKVKRFIDLTLLSKESQNALKFKLHINPATHKKEVKGANQPRGIAASDVQRQARSLLPSSDPGMAALHSLMKGFEAGKVRVVKYEEGKEAVCIYNTLTYKLQAKKEDNGHTYHSLSISHLKVDPVVHQLSERAFNHVMNMAAEVV